MFGGEGDAKFVAAATAKIQFWRVPLALFRFFHPMINKYDSDLLFIATAKSEYFVIEHLKEFLEELLPKRRGLEN